MMKWEYKSEMRVKALMQMVLCRERLPKQYEPEDIQALLLGDNMERAYEILMSATTRKRNYFILDGNYDNFYYIPNNHFGEVMLKLLCDNEKSAELDGLLSQNLTFENTGSVVENDGTDTKGNPVLFAYLMDLPRIMRFNLGLELLGRKGTIICFDFQAEMFKNYCCDQISIETINFEKYEGRFSH